MNAISVGHLKNLESPWANAGGVLRTIEDVESMASTGVGWLEVGSYTLESRDGNGSNGEVVYFHDHLTGETFNSIGMPNKGIDLVEDEIPEMVRIAHKKDKKLVVNIAPTTDHPGDEAAELVVRAYSAGADAVLLNAGCPNVVTSDGGRHEILSRNASELSKTLGSISLVFSHRPIFVRITPQETKSNMSDICKVVVASGIVSAVFTPNTWPGATPIHDGKNILEVSGGVGGKSGPATATEAAIQTLWTVDALRNRLNKIDVVSSGGITNGKELKKRLKLGAVAGAGTTFYYESEDWKQSTHKLLQDFIDYL